MRTPKFDITAYEGPALDLENIAKASKKKSEIDAILSAAASLRTHGEFVVKLLADLEEAQAKLAAAEKDAERYQFLETRAYVGVNPHHKTCMWVLRGIFELPGQSFEVAIDTAIAVGKEQP